MSLYSVCCPCPPELESPSFTGAGRNGETTCTRGEGGKVRVARVLIGVGLAALAAAGTYLAARDRILGANGAPLARPVPVTAGTVEEKAGRGSAGER